MTHYLDPAQLAECKDFYTIYNNIEFGHGGEGNIDEEPFFTYSGEYPYSLMQFSPCINTGTPDTTGLFLPLFDYAGNERIYDYRIDMGAFEWQGYAVDDVPNIETLLNAYPNPFSTSTTISYATTNLHESTQIKIYNIKGQLVRTLAVCSFSNPCLSMCEAVWDGNDEKEYEVSSGVYFYRISTDNQHIGKVVKIR